MPGWKLALKEMLAGMKGFIGIALILIAWYWIASDIRVPSEFYR
jgi:hypothetical protein